MKSISIALACLASLATSFGGVGDTREQSDSLYGKPSCIYTKEQLEGSGWFPPLWNERQTPINSGS